MEIHCYLISTHLPEKTWSVTIYGNGYSILHRELIDSPTAAQAICKALETLEKETQNAK